MYRDRIANTATKHPAEARLKEAMLNYHDFQRSKKTHPFHSHLALWQSQRLIHSHQDVYRSPFYHEGLLFLFTELYSDTDFSERDRDLERIFPKLIKLLPNAILETVSLLVELNMLTQKLDHELAEKLFVDMACKEIDEASYSRAYQLCQNENKRRYQIELTKQLGLKLDKYARSQVILLSLKLSGKPARKAGLGALHHFLSQGFQAFHSMRDIDMLMNVIAERELGYLKEIMRGNLKPFDFQLTTSS